MIPDLKVEVLGNEIFDDHSNFGGYNDSGEKYPLLLDSKDEAKYRSYRHQYAELLYFWGLPVHRVKILKFNINHNTDSSYLRSIESSENGDIHKGVISQWIKPSNGDKQHKIPHTCGYCMLNVKRRLFVCGNCQHVMHAKCSDKWWKTAHECPTGCGCMCSELFDVA
ncbi:uncharacterized protein SCODWIG_03432 [Saccharomycodes ludwigii]|uniref:WDR59/RTC1-like RING zinc finger domain-containing protein n=1 Tax=Saccharomycodes ludwigii TaxID=36035 RepID=A0A376BAP9_9ASCO|nr:uncharacterized protein SCODWIG_03432 [Saccharomycodes ludwigii]